MKDLNIKYTFAILGGDKRQTVIARKLIACGHTVKLFALGEYGMECTGAEICSTVDKAVEKSDVVILPLPALTNELELSVKFAGDDAVSIADIIASMKKYGCGILLGGMLKDSIMDTCEAAGISCIDYYKNEELQLKNALPSAEGALMVAMENTEITVEGMKAFVCGYGRIGSILASLLRKMGAEVTVGARRDEVLCSASMSGHKAVRLESGFMLEDDYDVIFNTVPGLIFSEKVLRGIKNKPVYVEIASKPGGIDTSAARECGLRIIYAPSLPGRYSPVSAGGYIFETVSDILAERGMKI